MLSRPAALRTSSWANSSTSRTQPVNVSDISAGTPSMSAITRTGICWRVVLRGVGGAVVDEPVDQPVAEISRELLVLVDSRV